MKFRKNKKIIINKSIEEFTVKEAKQICKNKREKCKDCPFINNEGGCLFKGDFPYRWDFFECK